MKILVVRLSSIGDIVLTTPLVRCLKKQIPGVQVHYLTKSQFEGLLSNNPYIDAVHTLKKSMSDTLQSLKKERFDLIVDLHHNWRTLIIKTYFWRVKSNSFAKLNVEKWLMVHLKIDILPRKHIVDRYFDTLKPLNIKNDGQGLDFFIDERKIDLKVIEDLNYVAFVIGGQHFTKRLPTAKIVEICSLLPCKIVLLGGKTDEKEGKTIEDQLSMTQNPCINLCGKIDLNHSAAVVKGAAFVITNDTGLMHIAAAFKQKIVSVWGNTIPEFGMSPYIKDDSFKVEVQNLGCRPCSKIGFDRCPKGHFRCMNDIESNQIVEIIKNNLTLSQH